MLKLLENKTAFISGGSRGIGAAIVKKFAEHGAHIGFSYHSNTKAADEVCTSLSAMNIKYKAYRCDVTQPIQIQDTLENFLSEFGSIDILVNNAGIVKDSLAAILPLEDWNNLLATNLTSAFLHTQWALRPMIAARRGVILNMSSIIGVHGNASQSGYAASKAGLIGFTKSIAKEVAGRNVRCNVIAPGFIMTDMTEDLLPFFEKKLKDKIALQRTGTAAEVAEVALFLASDLAGYINGQVIEVCGGLQL
jgi:3-oxoacyl-[acyl-carrier protein] reductase